MADAAATFTSNLLNYGPDIHDVVGAADGSPNDATLAAYAAAATMFSMKPASFEAAARYVAQAISCAKTREELQLARAMQAWHAGRPEQAIKLLQERLALQPDDLASLKICQILQIDTGNFAGMVDTVRAVLPYHPGNHFLLGQLAFALEEAGRPNEAKSLALQALAGMEKSGDDDPWSVHAYMHVQHRQGFFQESIDLVVRSEPLWERCGTFMRVHAWWHAAIAALELDQWRVAIKLYDQRLANLDVECVQSLIANVSLLARLTLHGIDVGNRWQPLQDALRQRAGDGINGFLDVHYVYGLGLAQDTAAARIARSRLHGLSARTAEALLAHAEGRNEEAADALAALRPDLHRLGGSHEQRQLYELVELDAAHRSAPCVAQERYLA